MKKWSYI